MMLFSLQTQCSIGSGVPTHSSGLFAILMPCCWALVSVNIKFSNLKGHSLAFWFRNKWLWVVGAEGERQSACGGWGPSP